MKGYLYILMAMLVWGLEYILIKASAPGSSPFMAGIVMFSVGGGMLFFHLTVSRQFRLGTVKRNIKSLLLVGSIGAGCNIFLLTGVRLTSAANAAVLGKADVLFALIFSALVFHEPIRKNTLWFIPLMIIGMFLLSTGTGLNFGKTGQIGDWLVLGYAFLLALNAYFIKKSVKDTGALLLGFSNCLVNTVVFVVMQLIFYPVADFVSINRQSAAILMAGGLCVYLFFIGYYQALKRLPVWEVRLLMLGVPVVTAVLGFCFIGEVLSGRQLIGMVLILSGAAGILFSGRSVFMKKEILTVGLSSGHKGLVESAKRFE
jgi:drug/metabolite transporter (DMT)-like permease